MQLFVIFESQYAARRIGNRQLGLWPATQLEKII